MPACTHTIHNSVIKDMCERVFNKLRMEKLHYRFHCRRFPCLRFFWLLTHRFSIPQSLRRVVNRKQLRVVFCCNIPVFDFIFNVAFSVRVCRRPKSMALNGRKMNRKLAATSIPTSLRIVTIDVIIPRSTESEESEEKVTQNRNKTLVTDHKNIVLVRSIFRCERARKRETVGRHNFLLSIFRVDAKFDSGVADSV